jgi:crotonobetainyl-CoA:carnitine CoA-transferase CaiB-like acyl-CoA transferase
MNMASDAAQMGRPLDGLRVIDCSRVLAGPFCGSILHSGTG